MSPATVVCALGGLCAFFVFVAFRQTRSRWLATAALSPLLAIAGAVAWMGTQDRAEASHAQAEATTFGDGSHEAGASHAAGAAAPTESPAAGASSLDLGALLARATAAAGLALVQGPEPYTPSTLWNRIDGGAEQYTRRGLRRALFATLAAQAVAGSESTEFEAQLFELRTPQDAAALWDATEREAATPLSAGDAAVTWEGGGEVRAGSLYARLVCSTGAAGTAAEAQIRNVLTALGALDGRSGAPPEPPPSPAVAAPIAQPAPAVAAPATPASPPVEGPAPVQSASVPGVFPQLLVAMYGVESVAAEPQDPGPRFRARSALEALAFCQATRPKDASALGRFGWRDPHAALVPQGRFVVAGPASQSDALLQLALASPHPALLAFPETDDVRIALSGWAGNTALGATVVVHEPALQRFAASPADPGRALDALVRSLRPADGEAPEGLKVGTDPYVGYVAVARVGKVVVGAAGHGAADDVVAAARALAARLRPLD